MSLRELFSAKGTLCGVGGDSPPTLGYHDGNTQCARLKVQTSFFVTPPLEQHRGRRSLQRRRPALRLPEGLQVQRRGQRQGLPPPCFEAEAEADAEISECGGAHPAAHLFHAAGNLAGVQQRRGRLPARRVRGTARGRDGAVRRSSASSLADE